MDGAGVVYQDINFAECSERLFHRSLHLVFESDIHDAWQCFAAGYLDFLGSGINRSRKLWMRLSRLGSDCDIGAIFGGPQRDCLTDAAAGSGYE